MFERRLYLHLDWLLLGAILCLALIGVGDDLQHDRNAWRLPTTQILRDRHRARSPFAVCLTSTTAR